VSELLEEYYSNYEDARGIDEETISNLVMRAKRKLIEDELQKEFSTAEDFLELRKNLIKFTSGSHAFDILRWRNRNPGFNRDCRRVWFG
jgi:hypothetical protein